MYYDDLDEELEGVFAPERVDDRLDRLELEEELSGEDGILPAHGESQDIQTRFLEAIKPRPVLQQPLLNCLSPLQQGNRQETSLWSAPGRKFTDLPLDVFLEVRVHPYPFALRYPTLSELISDSYKIAPHLYPLDIINLSRTSKPLRSLLMSKSSQPIWTTALGKVVELPPCPHDMSEPFYAALVFDCHCFACGVNGAFAVDYALRVRMCERCYNENVVEATTMLESLPKNYREVVSNVVLMLVPSANSFNFRNVEASTDRINPLSHLMQDSYFKPELEAVLRFFWPLRNTSNVAEFNSGTLVRMRINYVMKRQAHAALIHGWDTVHCTVDDYTERLNLFSRFKRVFRNVDTIQLRGEYWDEETYPTDAVFFEYLGAKPRSPSPLEFVANLPPFVEDEASPTSPAEPEPDIPKPHSQLATEMRLRKARESEAHGVRIRARYAQLEEWYTYVVEGRGDESPNFCDARGVWDDLVWADDARGPLNDDIVMRESELYGADNALQGYPEDVVNSLGRTLHAVKMRRAEAEAEAKAAHENEDADDDEGSHDKRGRKRKGRAKVKKPPRPEDPETAVRRPTALFRCTKCGDSGYAWPGINAHWCQKHREESVWDDHGEFKAEVWEDGVEVAERILAALIERGLGTRERGRMDLDYLIKDGRVFCACGDPRMAVPAQGLNWTALVKHVFAHLNENARRTLEAENEEDEAPVWIDNHELASCIRYLPHNADKSEASQRVRADTNTRARINACLGRCPQKSRPLCCLCDALTPDDERDNTLFLPEDVDAMLYHMQAKHGLDFEEKNVVFLERSALP